MSSNVSLNCLTNGAFLSKWNAANIPAAPSPRVARPPSRAGTIAAAIAIPMAIPHGPAAASSPENMPPPPAPPPAADAVRSWPNRLLNEFAASSPATSASRFAASNPAFVSFRDLTTISTLFSATGHHLLRQRQNMQQPDEPDVRVGGRRDPEPLPQTRVHLGLHQLNGLGYGDSIGSDASSPSADGVGDAFGTCVMPSNQPSNMAMNKSVSSDRTPARSAVTGAPFSSRVHDTSRSANIVNNSAAWSAVALPEAKSSARPSMSISFPTAMPPMTTSRPGMSANRRM